jgi:hypothetical protein
MVVDKSPDPCSLPLVIIISVAQATKVLFYFYERYLMMVFGQSLTVFRCVIVLTLLKFKYTLDGATFRLSHVLWIASAASFLEHLTILAIYHLGIFVLFVIGLSVLGRHAAVDLLGLITNLIETFVSVPSSSKSSSATYHTPSSCSTSAGTS